MSAAIDPATLRAMFAGSAAGTALLVLAVVRGWSDAADARLLGLLRLRAFDPARRPPRLVTAARDLSALGGDMLRGLLLAGCAIGLLAAGLNRIALRLLAIVLAARFTLILLKRVARRARPDPGAGHVATYTSSFPSGHTCMAAVLFVAAALLIPAPGAVQTAALIAALAVSLAIGATRILLGIHWPSDVAVGWLAGIAWATGGVLLGN